MPARRRSIKVSSACRAPSTPRTTSTAHLIPAERGNTWTFPARLVSGSMATHHSARVPAVDGGFAALGLSPTLCQGVAELGFATPTPVQARAIPLLLAGRDLIGQSTTGTGKTAAFALAILQKLRRGERHPQALILCPTRELCAQVARDFRRLGRRETGLAVVILSGGQPMTPQLEALQRGVH